MVEVIIKEYMMAILLVEVAPKLIDMVGVMVEIVLNLVGVVHR